MGSRKRLSEYKLIEFMFRVSVKLRQAVQLTETYLMPETPAQPVIITKQMLAYTHSKYFIRQKSFYYTIFVREPFSVNENYDIT